MTTVPLPARAFALAAVVLLAGCARDAGDGAPVDDAGEGTDAAPPPDPPVGDGPPPALPPPGDLAWSDAARPRLARTEATCAAVGADIVLLGGFTSGTDNTGAVEVYNASADSWTDGPAVPVPVHHAPVAALGGRVYVLGGLTGPAFMPVSAAWSWAPGEANWTPETPLPMPRGAGGAAVVDGRIHVVGGYTVAQTLVARVDVYDPAAKMWGQGPDLPTARDHLAVGAIGPLVIAAAGRELSLSTNQGTTQVLDTSTGEWATVADVPTARGGVGGAITPWGFAVAGGEGDDGTFDEVEAYDAARDAWVALPPLPTSRHGLCVAAVGGRLHVITGGTDPGLSVSDTHEVLGSG